jgi:hypothetical protein
MDGIGGKTGKTSFAANVSDGEENLYKTSK